MARRRLNTSRVGAEPMGAGKNLDNAVRGKLSAALLPLLLVVLASPAAAHVQLDEPNGGETLTAGEPFEIRWQVLIQHNLENWDLWYSTMGDGGPWIPIATDLPPGDGTAGAMHSHLWTVPEEDSEEVRVRVRQDNTGTDYLDVSEANLTIVPSVPDGIVFADDFELGDTGSWTSVIP